MNKGYLYFDCKGRTFDEACVRTFGALKARPVPSRGRGARSDGIEPPTTAESLSTITPNVPNAHSGYGMSICAPSFHSWTRGEPIESPSLFEASLSSEASHSSSAPRFRNMDAYTSQCTSLHSQSRHTCLTTSEVRLFGREDDQDETERFVVNNSLPLLMKTSTRDCHTNTTNIHRKLAIIDRKQGVPTIAPIAPNAVPQSLVLDALASRIVRIEVHRTDQVQPVESDRLFPPQLDLAESQLCLDFDRAGSLGSLKTAVRRGFRLPSDRGLLLSGLSPALSVWSDLTSSHQLRALLYTCAYHVCTAEIRFVVVDRIYAPTDEVMSDVAVRRRRKGRDTRAVISPSKGLAALLLPRLAQGCIADEGGGDRDKQRAYARALENRLIATLW